MRRKPSIAGEEAHAARVARLTSFLATIALIAILGLARSAQASTAPGPPPAGVVPAPALAFDEEEGDEAEAGEDEGLEGEECEGGEAAGEGCESEADADAEAPPECLLSDVEPTVSTSGDSIRLRVRYAVASPAAVGVDYGLHGSRGSLYLGGEKRRVASDGVLQMSRRLNEIQLAKVLAARDFTVRLRVRGAPGYCQAFFERQLNVRRATPAGLAWSQSE
jgi:hypothetical protein